MSDLTSVVGTVPLQPGIAGDPFGQLLVALVVIALVIVIGRVVLAVAWKLITIAAVIVALLFVLSSSGIV